MDAATYLIAHSILRDLAPIPFMILMIVAFRLGWDLAIDVRRQRRIKHRFAKIR